MPFEIGPMRADEEPYILGTWRDAAWKSPEGRGKRRGAFNAEHNARVAHILLRSPTILVARIPDAPDVLLGWAVGFAAADAYCLAFAYTRFQSRGFGIMRELVGALARQAPEQPFVYSARSRFGHVFDRYGLEYAPLSQVLWPRRAA